MKDVLIIFCLLLLNGFFAMCEIALVSSRKSRLEQEAKKGSKAAETALKLLSEPEKFLSTVQIGITLVGIIAGAYGADSFTSSLQPYVTKITFLQPYAEAVTLSLIIIIVTYFSLVIGELVPKTIALNNPEKITIALAPFMKRLANITYPFVAFLSISTKLLLKILFIKERKDPPVTEEELKYMIDTGSLHGIIEKRESEIIHRVFKSEDKKVYEIMTNRKAILWIDINQSKGQIQSQVLQSGVTKFPICDGNLDELIGVASIGKILKYTTGKEDKITNSLSAPLYFPEHMTALKILDDFRKSKTHMGFVVNEHGNIQGLITLQDIIENIVGEIPETEDLLDDGLILRADGTFLVDGGIGIEKLIDKIEGVSISEGHKTLSEFITYQLQEMPRAGLYFKFGNYRFEIVDMDGTKIDKILIGKT
jgi:putative hemolysin